VFLSHEIVTTAARAAVANIKGLELNEITATPKGYRCRGRVGVGDVTIVLVPEVVTWARDAITVTLGTPDGVQIEARPVLNALAAAIIMVVGGTKLGEVLLSTALPEQVRWDGEHAVCVFSVPKGAAHRFGRTEVVTLNISQDARGLWLQVESLSLLEILIRAIIESRRS